MTALLTRVLRHPALRPAVILELWRERNGGHLALPAHGPHLLEAVAWLERAQDATVGGGVSRGYSLAWHSVFASRGWQPPYPETTGYLIPTLYQAARHLARPELARRAERAARWEIEVQLPSGAVQGGVIGQPVAPAVFNTGQVIFGWLAAFRATGDAVFADAARRAARFLVNVMDPDGLWRRGNSLYADAQATLYNTRTAWALAEAGRALGVPACMEASARSLHAAARLRHDNGWFPDCCLTDRDRPLLHTLAYTIRGLFEGGRVLEDERLIDHAALAAERLAACVAPDGSMPGRLSSSWSAEADWSCLTGQAQMAGVWLRLHELTGERKWLEPVSPVLQFLKATQNRSSEDPGLRGGIKGSFPLDGEYGRYEVLNWATKFFVDALIRDDRRAMGVATAEDDPLVLA